MSCSFLLYLTYDLMHMMLFLIQEGSFLIEKGIGDVLSILKILSIFFFYLIISCIFI